MTSEQSGYVHTRFTSDSESGYVYDHDAEEWITEAAELWRLVRPILKELDAVRAVQPAADSPKKAVDNPGWV